MKAMDKLIGNIVAKTVPPANAARERREDAPSPRGEVAAEITSPSPAPPKEGTAAPKDKQDKPATRRKAGRPPKDGNKAMTATSVKMPPDLLDAVRAWGRLKNIPTSDIVVRAITAYMEPRMATLEKLKAIDIPD